MYFGNFHSFFDRSTWLLVWVGKPCSVRESVCALRGRECLGGRSGLIENRPGNQRFVSRYVGIGQ